MSIIHFFKIYGYYCQNERCIFNKDDINKLIEEKKLIKPEEKNVVEEFIIEIIEIIIVIKQRMVL